MKPAKAAPDRKEGEGPFKRLVIRGATLIDGTGAPPVGPADIVIEEDRIAAINFVGYPKVPIDPKSRPAGGDYEIDAHGMYVLPGFVDCHAHIATPMHGLVGEVPSAEYVFKLWMAHGITTIREVACGNGLGWTVEHARRSAKGEITAPHIEPYATFPSPSSGVIRTPEQAREWVRGIVPRGATGIKFFGSSPEIMKAALDEAKKQGLRTTCHHAQLNVTRMNVDDTSSWGLTSMEHWYGLPEALFVDRVIQDYPPDYNYNDEQNRFGEAGRLWKQAAPPGSPRWHELTDDLIERDFTLVPTLTIYEASRDLMRAMRAEWHDEYTLPTLWRWFAPNRKAHGAYWFYWTTTDEVEWKRNYQLWMQFINNYKNKGGRVGVGSDAGFIYKLFGFAYVRELELLQEAGFHPLEVIRAATMMGAQLTGLDSEIGSVEVGKRADLVIVPANPLQNLKVLYGTGAIKLNDDTGEVERIGGVRWTVRNGIVFDAPKLLADVRKMVIAAKKREARK
ncbi:MAG: amidohydrolase family protein [Acidobacteriota bacterium]|nr:amidohydrolase family protein [Acidobacteriota bacterium]